KHKVMETFSWMPKLADVTESISFLEEQLKSIKERILEVEEDMEQLIAASTSLFHKLLAFKKYKRNRNYQCHCITVCY
uniref:hypothetical protein n=1 Tax=Bacteroides thetaiotaomicron TaxID=818 RepID=UPI000AB256E1